jgi:F0F1-type ATP synthase membrane subunit a
MSTNQRGCFYLVGLLVFGFFACILFPLMILPSVGTAVSLPVITVPAEYYRKDWPSPDFELVNSLGGALLANIIVLLIAFRARAVSKGWTQEVPGRFQGFVELIGAAWWSLTKEQAGTKPKVKYILFPLVASIFLFLLAGNLGKLLPGVETVGVLHCAVYEPVALNGFPIHQVDAAGTSYFVLRNETVLNTGTTGTSKSYYQCNAGIGEHKYIKDGYLVTDLDPYLDQAVVHTTEEGDTLASILAAYNVEAEELISQPLPESEGRDDVAQLLADGNYYQIELTYDDPYAQYNSWRPVEFTLEDVILSNAPAGGGEVALAFAGHGEEGAAEEGDHNEDGAATEETSEEAEASAPALEDVSEVAIDGAIYTLPHGATLNTPLEAGQEITLRPELFGESATTRLNQIYTVAPFIRGVSTDLSFTIGLALLAFVAIQAFGFSELGLGYLQKFINVGAIGNIAKRPLGAIDFVVGLFEIISEVGKIISLSFRLFGALFAGTVLYAVIMFLVGTTVPVIILGLEIIVGTAQAGVFAVLTMLFCAQAMVSHHHDDEHGEEHH